MSSKNPVSCLKWEPTNFDMPNDPNDPGKLYVQELCGRSESEPFGTIHYYEKLIGDAESHDIIINNEYIALDYGYLVEEMSENIAVARARLQRVVQGKSVPGRTMTAKTAKTLAKDIVTNAMQILVDKIKILENYQKLVLEFRPSGEPEIDKRVPQLSFCQRHLWCDLPGEEFLEKLRQELAQIHKENQDIISKIPEATRTRDSSTL